MSKFTYLKHGIAMFALTLAVGITTVTGSSKSLGAITADAEPSGSFLITTSDAHITELMLGKDKKMSDPTDEFGTEETIFAAVKVAGIEHAVKVKGRLHVVDIAGQKPGPIPGLETIVTLSRDGVANFQFSKPTRGWPHGHYKFEALVIDENGETIDKESHEFTVE